MADLKPHRGQQMVLMGILSLFVGPPIVSVITWLMARADLKEMDAGRMDPAGRSQTQTARLLAMISTIGWPLVYCCCCTGLAANDLFQGSSLIPALGSRRITRQEFDRIRFGMNKKEVTDLVGPPARTEREPGEGRPTWYWYEKNGPATFHINFGQDERVNGIGEQTPD